MARKKKDSENPELHKSLKGFDIKINEFGELISSFPIDKLNDFLDKEVEDKKLKNEVQKKEEEEE